MERADWLATADGIYRCSSCRSLYYYPVDKCPFCKVPMNTSGSMPTKEKLGG